jgi:hypothetical protein
MTEAMQILVGLLAEVRSNLKQVDQSSEPELRDLLGSALRGLEKALHRKPTVVVSGEPNSGKTSVANLLAGLEVLPAAVVANTAVPVLLRHGVSPSVFAVTPEGRLPLSVAMGDAYQPYLYADLERIEVGLPSMRDHGFEILDTPSWAERDRLIEDADVLIWCSVAARPWTESERKALSDLPLARLSHRGCGRHGGQMADRQGETRSAMWVIGQVVRHRLSAIWPRPKGRPGRAIGSVGPLNRMNPYAFRVPPCRWTPPWAMTTRIPVRKAG